MSLRRPRKRAPHASGLRPLVGIAFKVLVLFCRRQNIITTARIIRSIVPIGTAIAIVTPLEGPEETVGAEPDPDEEVAVGTAVGASVGVGDPPDCVSLIVPKSPVLVAIALLS